jgi:hypothetical protein
MSVIRDWYQSGWGDSVGSSRINLIVRPNGELARPLQMRIPRELSRVLQCPNEWMQCRSEWLQCPRFPLVALTRTCQSRGTSYQKSCSLRKKPTYELQPCESARTDPIDSSVSGETGNKS